MLFVLEAGLTCLLGLCGSQSFSDGLVPCGFVKKMAEFVAFGQEQFSGSVGAFGEMGRSIGFALGFFGTDLDWF